MKRIVVLALALALSFSTSQAFAVNSLPSGITLFTTEKMYIPGQTVHVMGQIYDYSGGSPMLLTVYSPERVAVYSEKMSSAGQIIEFTFPLDKGETREGTWKVVAIYADQKAETTFALVSKSGFHEAILGKPVLRDNMGQLLVPENQKVGAPMVVSAELENDEENTSYPFVYVLQVLDKNGIPVHVSFVTGSIRGGQTANPSVSWTPTAPGTYTTQVFVWNSLDAPVPLAEKQTGTFEIIS